MIYGRGFTIKFAAMAAISISVVSCQSQTVEYFELTVVAGQQLVGGSTDPLRSAIRSLANYCSDPNCSNEVFVPEVALVRADFEPSRIDKLQDPLSSLNRWRKKINLLPGANVIADYDEGWHNLTVPATFEQKSDHEVELNTMRQEYPSADILLIDDSLMARTEVLRERIASRFCKDGVSDIAIILYRSPIESQIDPDRTAGSSLLSDSISERNKQNASQPLPKREPEANVIIAEFEKQAVAEQDPFALYELCKTIMHPEAGKNAHHRAFEMLKKAVNLAIKHGKRVELQNRISADLEADEKRPLSERTIWRLSDGHADEWDPIVSSLAGVEMPAQSEHHEE